MGKTTCAAAMALTASLRGGRTLVVSTDPAPSLGDAFGRPLGPEPRKIPTRRGLLHAVEIDAPAALARWLNTRRTVLERLALRGTWLDGDDISRLLRLSLPGIDELAALLEIARFAASGAYDLVVVDTAPTGHTLRMLGTPDTLRALAGVFDGMQAKHRIVVETLRGRWSPRAPGSLLCFVMRRACVFTGSRCRRPWRSRKPLMRRRSSKRAALPCRTSSSTASRPGRIVHASGAMHDASLRQGASRTCAHGCRACH